MTDAYFNRSGLIAVRVRPVHSDGKHQVAIKVSALDSQTGQTQTVDFVYGRRSALAVAWHLIRSIVVHPW